MKLQASILSRTQISVSFKAVKIKTGRRKTTRLRPLTKAQTTKKLKFLSHKEENSRNFILEFFRLLLFFVQNEPRLTVLSTVFASVRLVCTFLSAQSS